MSFLPGRAGLILLREPVGRCYLCHVDLYSDRDVRLHMASGEHRDAIEDARAEREAEKRRLALFHEHPDPEVEAHMLRVGERMRREGRWEVKPNERAGFS